MSDINEWGDLMPHHITYEPVASRDAQGAPAYGTARQYQCRVVRRAIRTTNRANGQDEIGAGAVWLAAAIVPTIDDRITLPDGSQPFIINWEEPADEAGFHHTKLIFGAVQRSQSI